MAAPKRKKIEYDYYFVRNREYAGALKEANQYFEDGWVLKQWKYEATTMTFIFLLQRPKNYVKPEPIEETPRAEKTPSGANLDKETPETQTNTEQKEE